MTEATIKIFIWGVLWMTVAVLAGTGPHQFTLTAENAAIFPTPLSIDLEGFDIPQTHTVHLYRRDGEKKILLASQMETGRADRLWFVPDRMIQQGQAVLLELRIQESASPQADSSLRAELDQSTITLRCGTASILCYHHAEHPVPDGVDPIYRRSGFIHPLYSPAGRVLTRIQPPDHYHHYGIWNPWTKTQIEGRQVDFWNLAGGQGRVRFSGLLSTVAGPVYAGFKVHQEHVMYVGEERTEKNAINEVWDVRVSAMSLDSRPVWVVDFTTILNNALQTNIELSDYRYGGGLGFRATDDWTKENTVLLTSEGKIRTDADGTRARWCDIRGGGSNPSGMAGILFLSHIANREHPEPTRVWPENVTPSGEMFFEFCPIRYTAWTLEPNRDYVLRYRMIVYDGQLKPETADLLWKNFTQPPIPISQ